MRRLTLYHIAYPRLGRSRIRRTADDPVLKKPVTLAVKGEALADIMPMLQDQTGVLLRVSADTADRKSTIFVDNKPSAK